MASGSKYSKPNENNTTETTIRTNSGVSTTVNSFYTALTSTDTKEKLGSLVEGVTGLSWNSLPNNASENKNINLTFFAGGSNFIDKNSRDCLWIFSGTEKNEQGNEIPVSLTSSLLNGTEEIQPIAWTLRLVHDNSSDIPSDIVEGPISLRIGGDGSEPLILLSSGADNVLNLNSSYWLKVSENQYERVNVQEGQTLTNGGAKPDIPVEAIPDKGVVFTRKGNVSIAAETGNLFGFTGAIASTNIGAGTSTPLSGMALGKFSAKSTKSTLDGNVKITLDGHVNVAGLTSAGTAISLGGESYSIVTGNTNLDVLTQKQSTGTEGIVLGVAGGGSAVAFFDGQASAEVNGDTLIRIKGSKEKGPEVGFVTGGGLAIAGNMPEQLMEVVNDKIGVDTIFEAVFEKEHGLGTAKTTSEKVGISIENAATLAVSGGGVAIVYKQPNAIGTGEAKSIVASTNIQIGGEVPSSDLVIQDKNQLFSDIKETVRSVVDSSGLSELYQNTVAGMNRLQKYSGVTVATFGGGISAAYEQGEGDQVPVKASSTVGTSTLTINGGYNFGVVGGGAALASGYGEGLAESNVNGAVSITVNGGENIGLIGGGAAAFAGSNEKSTGIASTADVGEVVIKLNGGSVDGIFGGGLAVDLDVDDVTNVRANATSVTIRAEGSTKLSYMNWKGFLSSDVSDHFGNGVISNFIKKASGSLNGATETKAVIIGGGTSVGLNKDKAGTKVDKVNIYLGKGVLVEGATQGECANIYAGGYATYGGLSTVGNAEVTVEGAEINGDIYMGGVALGEGSRTQVGDVAINLLSGSLKGELKTTAFTGEIDGKSANKSDSTVGNLKLTIGSDFAFAKNSPVIDASGLQQATVVFNGSRDEDNGLKLIDFEKASAGANEVNNVKFVNKGKTTTFTDGTFTLASLDAGETGNYIVGTSETPAFVTISDLKKEGADVSVAVVNGAVGLSKTHEVKEHHDFAKDSKPTLYISSEDHGTVYSDIVVGNVEAAAPKLMAMALGSETQMGTVKVGSNGQVIVNVDPAQTTVAKANWDMHPNAQLKFVKVANGSKVNLGKDISEIQSNYTTDNQLLELKKLDEDHTHIFNQTTQPSDPSTTPSDPSGDNGTFVPKPDEDQKELGVDDPDVGRFYANLPADSALKARVDSSRKINMANLKAGMNLAAAAGVQTAATDVSLMGLDISSKRASLTRDYVNGTEAFAEITGITQTMGGNSSMNKIRTNLGGVAFGADYSMNDWTFGALANLGAGTVKGRSDNSGVKNDVDYYGFQAYAAKRFAERFNLVAQASYTYSKNDLKDTAIGYTKAEGVHAHVFSIGARAETSFALSSACRMVPYIGANYLRVNTKGYTTSNGTKVGSTHQNLVNMPVGVAFTGKKTLANGWMVKPNVDVAYVPTFGDHNVRATTTEGTDVGSVSMDVWTKNVGRAKVGVEAGKGAWRAGAFVGFAAGQNKAKEAFGQVSLRYTF